MEGVALGIVINLASTLLMAGGRRVAEEALGDEGRYLQQEVMVSSFRAARHQHRALHTGTVGVLTRYG